MSNEILHQTTNTSAPEQKSLPRVAILLTPAMRTQMLTPEALKQLATVASVVTPQGNSLNASDLPQLLDGAIAALSGWGTPPLSDELISSQPSLMLVAHTAGTVRRLISESALEKGLHVSHAAAIIAESVAEFVVSQALLCLRHLHEIDRSMKSGSTWGDIRSEYPGMLLGSRSIGVVGTGRVGRAVIHLLKAFGCRIFAYDPYLTTEQAVEMGVEAVGLEDLLTQSEVITLHAPVLPETSGMIGATQLAMLRDHTVFINAARSVLVDENALFQELKSGRLTAALDVFNEEPLPLTSRFRSLHNVVLSPHTAGHTIDAHMKQGQTMVDEIVRFLRREPLQYEITASIYKQLA
jgi:phosphoglycerate dehydrogenase-like enzyme